MRSKLNTTLVVAALGLFTIATACGDDTGSDSPGGGEAGESGSGSGGDGATSSGGSATSGSGGSSSGNGGSSSGNGGSSSGSGGEPVVSGGNGGDPAVNGGSSSGNGGDAAVNGGESGNAGESGGGGEPSGSGGAAAGAGGGGPVTCTPITLSPFELGDLDPAYATYAASFTPNIGAAAADSFVLSIQAPPGYDGNLTGTFDLTENGDENYKTCSRCLLVVADPNGARTVYYASEGTLVIDPASTQLSGNLDATITNLTLVEVTIANDYTSTPVPNGRCLTVASAEIAVVAPPCDGPQCVPVGWTCDFDFVGDGDCDCGCGAKDTDCAGTTDAGECEYCVACSANFEPCGTGEVDPADTTMCL